jgi:hypothetical protein
VIVSENSEKSHFQFELPEIMTSQQH